MGENTEYFLKCNSITGWFVPRQLLTSAPWRLYTCTSRKLGILCAAYTLRLYMFYIFYLFYLLHIIQTTYLLIFYDDLCKRNEISWPCYLYSLFLPIGRADDGLRDKPHWWPPYFTVSCILRRCCEIYLKTLHFTHTPAAWELHFLIYNKDLLCLMCENTEYSFLITILN